MEKERIEKEKKEQKEKEKIEKELKNSQKAEKDDALNVDDIQPIIEAEEEKDPEYSFLLAVTQNADGRRHTDIHIKDIPQPPPRVKKDDQPTKGENKDPNAIE